MNRTIAALLSFAFVFGLASTADAYSKRKRFGEEDRYTKYRSPSAIAERQRHRSTFDETQYYERLSEKIPLGTDAWWRQRQIESIR